MKTPVQMKNRIFDTHYGKSSLADEETGIVIEWTNGDFNGTQKVHFEKEITPDPVKVAKIMREMGDYIAENYPELI